MIQRDLKDLTYALANRELALVNPDNKQARLAAALPDLAEEDRHDLRVTMIEAWIELGSLRTVLLAHEALIDTVLMGIEVGREMERWSHQQVTA